MKIFRNRFIASTLMLGMMSNVALACQPTNAEDIMASVSSSQTLASHAAKDIKLALLLDTSNSMDGLIDQAKSQLWTIVNELATTKCTDDSKPNLKIALYEYGNSGLSSESGHIRQVCGLTDDLDLLSEKLFALSTNGGDEYCGQVIQTSLKNLEWGTDESDVKMIFIAGNEPFTQGNVLYKTACKEAKNKGVVVNTIFCGDFDTGIAQNWKDGADITAGNYMSIQQNQQTVFVESPYDDKIDSLNTVLNDTYIPYGVKGQEKKANQVAQDANAERYGKAYKVKRSVSKSTSFYSNKSWDLVDAVSEEEVTVSDVAVETLPAEMKDLNAEERKAYVLKKAEERKKVQLEINTLNANRKQYVSEQQKETNNEGMLDKVMLEAVKKQAIKKGLKFEN